MTATGDERVDRRLIATLCLAAAAGMINYSAFGPFIPDIADDFDSTIPVLGQVAAVSAFVSAIVGFFAGPLADHYGQRRILSFSLLFTMASALCVASAQDYWWLILGGVLSGCGLSTSIGVAYALATVRYSGKARLAAMSILTASLSISGVLGIPVLTQIAAPFSWRGAWVFIACLALVALLLLRLNVPASVITGTGRFRLQHMVVAYAPLLRDRKVLWLFCGSVLMGVTFSATMTYAGSFFIEEFGLSVQQYGLIAIFTGIGFFSGSLAAGKLGRFDLRRTFALACMFTGVLLFIAYSLPAPMVITVLVLTVAFFFVSIQDVNITTLISNATSGGQGTAMVMNETTFAIGAAFGASIGGLLIQVGGFMVLGYGIAVSTALTTLAIWRSRTGNIPVSVPVSNRP